MTEKTKTKKIREAYNQIDNPWTGNNVIKELHKITSIQKQDFRSCLAKVLYHDFKRSYYITLIAM